MTLQLVEHSGTITLKVGQVSDQIDLKFYSLKLKPDVVDTAANGDSITLIRPQLPCEASQSKPKKVKGRITADVVVTLLGGTVATVATKSRGTKRASPAVPPAKVSKKDKEVAINAYGSYSFLMANSSVDDANTVFV